MAMIVVPGVVSLVTVAFAAAYAHWRTRVRRTPANAANAAAVGFIVQALLALPVVYVTAATHRWIVPHDDWNDIVGGGGCIVQLALAPIVAAAVWLIVHLYDRRFEPKYAHLCRRCRHELTGVTSEPDALEPLGRCPECGLLQSLSAARGRAIGSRQ